MKLFLGVIVVVAACGKVEDPHHLADAPPAPKDGALDAPADAMADAAPPRCDPMKPFGTPSAMVALNTGANESGATLTSDELTIVFSSDRTGGPGGGGDLYVATRTTPTGPFGAPSLLAGVNTAGAERRPSITGDGLALYAEFQLNPNSASQIVRATRSSAAGAFGALAPVAGINVNNEATPYVLPDNSALYFASRRGVNGDQDIYVASGTAGSFGTPTLVTGTNVETASNEYSPVVTPSQLEMYFSSDRAQNLDVLLTRRTSVATAFGDPLNVSALNTTSPEIPDAVSADGCMMIFHRNVGLAASNNDLYVAIKPL